MQVCKFFKISPNTFKKYFLSTFLEISLQFFVEDAQFFYLICEILCYC